MLIIALRSCNQEMIKMERPWWGWMELLICKGKRIESLWTDESLRLNSRREEAGKRTFINTVWHLQWHLGKRQRQRVVRAKASISESTCVVNDLISKTRCSYLKKNAHLVGLYWDLKSVTYERPTSEGRDSPLSVNAIINILFFIYSWWVEAKPWWLPCYITTWTLNSCTGEISVVGVNTLIQRSTHSSGIPGPGTV